MVVGWDLEVARQHFKPSKAIILRLAHDCSLAILSGSVVHHAVSFSLGISPTPVRDCHYLVSLQRDPVLL